MAGRTLKTNAVTEYSVKPADIKQVYHEHSEVINPMAVAIAIIWIFYKLRRKLTTSGFKDRVFSAMPVFKDRVIEVKDSSGNTVGSRSQKVRVYPAIKYKFRTRWASLITNINEVKWIEVKSHSVQFDNNPNILIAAIKSEFGLTAQEAQPLGGGWYRYEINYVEVRDVVIR